jgi:hypothetical protein
VTADVRFVINSQIKTAEELIEWIGLQPEEHWSKAEIRPGGPRRGYRNTGVIYYPTIDSDESVGIVHQVHALLDRLEPIRERLLVLKEYCKTEGIDLTYRITFFDFIPLATVAWFELSDDDLKRIASYATSFEFELIWNSGTNDPANIWEDDVNRGFFYEDQWNSNHGITSDDSSDFLGHDREEN